MSDQDLRDLLQERVADLTTADLAATALVETAWRDATRVRTRRRTTAVASAAAAVLAVAGVVAITGDRSAEDPGGGPATSVPSPSGGSPAVPEAPTATRMDDYRGAAVWEAPPAEAELDLPRWTEPSLPEVLDLGTASPGLPGTPVRGLLTEDWRVFALSATGTVTELDVARLDPVSDEGGNRLNPVSAHSLSPDGARVLFIQESSLEVLDLATGRWQTIDTPDWLAEGARWVTTDEIWVPDALGSRGAGTSYGLDGTVSQAHVRWLELDFGEENEGGSGVVATSRDRVAQTMFLAGPVDGTGVSNPEAVVVRTGARVDILTMWPLATATRQKGCCEVLGFLDADTVMFASKSTEGYRLLAWSVGTEDVYLVSRLAGPGALVAWSPAG